MRIHNPLPGLDLDVSPTARFDGYPPALSPGGIVAGDDQTNRFITVLDGFPHNRWHRDMRWTLGVPASDQGIIYTGLGGVGAVRGVMAINSVTGAVQWTFAPEGLPPDPSQIRTVVYPKTVTVPKGELRQEILNQAAAAARRQAARNGSSPSTRPTAPAPPDRPTITRPIGPDDFETRQIPVQVPQPTSLLPPGHWTNPGLVITGGRIYAEVNHTIAALDQVSGEARWRVPLDKLDVVRSMVATPEHLVLCVSQMPGGKRDPVWEHSAHAGKHRLLALRLDNGKAVWQQEVHRPGTLSIANNLLFFADGDLHVMGPPERTFVVSSDSPRREDYGQPSGTVEALGCGPVPDPTQPAPGARGAEGTTLRLTWGEPVEQMLRKISERRAAVPNLPLMLVLDWQNAQRTGKADGLAWSPAQTEAFIRTAATLARQARPEHFDLAPDLNLYLARKPREIEMMRGMLLAARAAVRQASPTTRVLVSLNVELLSGVYGRGSALPYGQVPLPNRDDLDRLLKLAGEFDEIGLASYPEAGFSYPGALPSNYLLDLREALPDRPLVVSQITVRPADKGNAEEWTRAAYVGRLLQLSYWLEAAWVSYPDTALRTTAAPTVQPAATQDPRPGDMVRQEILAWKRVDRLTLGTFQRRNAGR